MADPLILQTRSRHVGRHFFVMASSHVFYESKLQPWIIRRAGAFSVYREGVDCEAVSAAIEILSSGERPLVIFPEGCLSHANDRLNALMAGVPFIARAAARKREKQSKDNAGPSGRGKVVVLPVAIKYLFKGDIDQTVAPVLDAIETRLSWRPRRERPLYDRIYDVGNALLTLKEVEYFGDPQAGELDERIPRLVDHVLVPLE